MEYAIKHLFHIDASKQQVFEAIASLKGLSNWWTVKTSGSSEQGGSIKFDFGETPGPIMKVIHQANDIVVWECIESPHGWIGHRIIFSLDENEEKTRVHFSHEGWLDQDDFYAICNFSWGRYLESLRQYCQTGKGQAFGSEDVTN